MLCLGDDPRILTALTETLHIKLSGCKSFFLLFFSSALSQLPLIYRKITSQCYLMGTVFCHDKKILFLALSLKIPSQIEKSGVSFWHLTKVDICPVFHTFFLCTTFWCLKEGTGSSRLTRPTKSLKKSKNKSAPLQDMWCLQKADCLISQLQFYFTNQEKNP